VIGELLSLPGTLGALAVSLVIFGFAPGMLLALIVRLFHEDDPRRGEFQAELYVVPRWERPFWVFEKLDLALRQGLFPEISWWCRQLGWHRTRTDSRLQPPPVPQAPPGPEQ
jgi:hypothetical protein